MVIFTNWRVRHTMIARDLERLLTFHSGYQAGEVDQRTRPLRGHNLIPHGPRGVNALDLEPLHAALMVLTMVSRRAADAGEVAMRAMDLELVPRRGFPLDATALAVHLAAGIVAGSGLLRRMDIACDGSIAWAEIVVKGKAHRVFFTDDPKVKRAVADDPSTYEATGGTYAGHWFILTGAVLDQITLKMAKASAAASAAAKPKRTRQRELAK
jgi:hypothetical protein